MARSFWFKDHPEERMPQSFTRRSKNFIQSVGKLYHLEPEEFRQFCWFVHRMRIAASKRDDLAHSKPGLVKRNGREYEGLWIEHPSAATRTIEMSVIDIEMLAEEISSLHVESGQVGMALHVAAQVAALREIPNPPTLGGLLPSVTGPRFPMQPRWNPPPPTFQP